MNSITTQGDLVDFLNDPGNAQKLDGQVDDIRYALMDYQVCTHEQSILILSDTCFRLHYNGTVMTSIAS